VYVILRTYDNYINANIALSKLLDAGIHAYLQDEHTVTVDPLLSLAINGIKLVVPKEEAPTASAMLGIMEDEYKASLSCPRCGSSDLEDLSKPKGLGSFFRGISHWLFLRDTQYFGSKYRCSQCGQEFEPPE
jgi:DNA-directed RNA polymerase subunit RPC12/RpoP